VHNSCVVTTAVPPLLRPLAVITTKWNFEYSGKDPYSYHAVDLALYAVVCFLFVQVCAKIFKKSSSALVAGILFAVHPVHVEVCQVILCSFSLVRYCEN
jgi:hypothetical protein